MFYKSQHNLDVTVFCCNHCVQRCVEFGLRKDFLSMIKRLIMRRISATVSFFHEPICLIVGSDNNCKVKCLAYLTSKSLNQTFSGFFRRYKIGIYDGRYLVNWQNFILTMEIFLYIY